MIDLRIPADPKVRLVGFGHATREDTLNPFMCAHHNIDGTSKYDVLNLTAATGVAFTAGQFGVFSATGVILSSAAALDTIKGLLVQATTDVSSGQPGWFRRRGIWVTSGLTIGATYYVSNTSGAVTAVSPSVYARVVGYALSTTQLLIVPDNFFTEV